MKPYIPYMGSKSTVAHQLVGHMPPEAYQTYIEVFGGCAAVFLAKARAKVGVINDFDTDIMNVHQAVASHPEAVMDELKRLPVSRLLYNQIKDQRMTASWFDLDPAMRAAYMIYLHCCAVNAKPHSPFPASASVPINFNPDKDLRPYSAMLRGRGVALENLHWSELLDRYVVKPKRFTGLLFLDPPYVVAEQSRHYRHAFGAVDHILLARKLASIHDQNGGERNVKIMVTYNDHPLIRTLYREEFGWRIHPLEIQYASGNHAVTTEELLITNY